MVVLLFVLLHTAAAAVAVAVPWLRLSQPNNLLALLLMTRMMTMDLVVDVLKMTMMMMMMVAMVRKVGRRR